MEFRNLTPFDALCFSALDPHDREYRVVVMRVSYRLVPCVPVKQPGWFDARLIEDDPPPLVLADRYCGVEGRSSLICESDLAPYKPRCDVIVTGSAHAPEGQPTTCWPARLRVGTPEIKVETDAVPHSKQRMHVLLDKKLVVHGPRQFRRTWLGRWELQNALPAAVVPLSYERAFGGASVVLDPSSDNHAPLINEVCFSNPLGCGWYDPREFKILQEIGQPVPELLPAPQLEYAGDPIQEPCFAQNPSGPLTPQQMLQAVQAGAHRSANFGAIGRAWTPRLQYAGTYDDAWLRERWPNLPEDFNYHYWNGAPADQQIGYPPPGIVVELVNLTDPTITPSGHLVTKLPEHRAYVLMRLQSGVMLPLPMVTDTIHVDTQLLRIDLVHRVWIPVGTPVRVLEARFEIDPQAVLVSLAPDARVNKLLEHEHGR